MSKKDKELKRLRREVEILRAQAKSVGGLSPEVPRSLGEVEVKVSPSPIPSSKYVQTDLRRSFLITTVILAVIGGLKVSQLYWDRITKILANVAMF